ncbi:MAG: beta strand repeat-containing protein [Syntrophothermus sp.]
MERKFTFFISLIVAFVCLGINIQAQTVINANTYRYNGANSAYVAITPTQLIGPNSDNVASAVTDIGFTFWFAGTPYTQFSVDENGLMKLGSSVIIPEPVNNMASTLNNPKIAPYWDDLATGPTGSVGYFLSGTAPNRMLIVEWNVILKNIINTPAIKFQARLYEGPASYKGNIFFRINGTPPSNTGGYSSGIGAAGNDFASLTVTAATSSSVLYGTANNNNTIGSTQQMQFTTDYTAPTIGTITIPNVSGTGNRTFNVTISDQAGSVNSGVPTTGTYVPRVYYKKNISGTYVSTAAILTSGDGTSGTWQFTIDHSLLGGVVEGDQVYYYVIAQDNGAYKGSPNISSNPTGVVAVDVNTITTPPTSPLYYTIPRNFSGTITVGTGGDFSSLTLVGGLFDNINSGQLTGNLTINIISDLTSETGLKGLNAWTNGPGGPFTMIIKPVGNRIISGITVNGGNGGVITLNGATGVTIDGLNDGTNSLTFIQTGQYYVGSVIDLKGASNNTITRVTVKGFGASNYGITLTNSISPFRPSSNNMISYCIVTTNDPIPNAGNGIGLLDWTGATSIGNLNVIDHNTISNFVYSEISISGKYANTVISNNEIYNTVEIAQANSFKAINLGSGISGTTNVFNNKIHDLLPNLSSGSDVTAIFNNGAAGTTSNIYNNIVYLDVPVTYPQQTFYGIKTSNPGAVNIYYNSIYIGGSGITAGSSYGLYRGGSGATNIRNNVIFNARSNSTGTGKHYGIYTTSTTSLASDYNDIFVNGNGGFFGFSTLDRLTLLDWQTATSKDLVSVSGNPGFTSTTNLQPDLNNPNVNNLNGRGLPIATIGLDILGNPRSTALPTPTDLGAYEFTLSSTSYIISGNAGTSSVLLSWFDGENKSVVADTIGNYSIIVPTGWSGSITPSKTGYSFNPTNRAYANVTSDFTNQNYISTLIINTISGKVTPAVDGGNVTITWNDNGTKTTTTDAQGNYWFSVPMGWTGDITPTKTDYIITPALIHIDNIQTDLTNQNFQIEIKYVVANLKVFLQGPFNVDSMRTNLWQSGVIPLNSNLVYPTSIYNYSESVVTTIPNNVVDWVLVELRNTTTTKVLTRAGFIKSNGSIVDIDGISPLKFSNLNNGDFYIVVRHRNHLAIMSSNLIPLSASSSLYDFTTALDKAFGTNSMKDLGNATIFGMYAGDSDGNEIINSNDYNGVGTNLFSNGYLRFDINLSHGVTVGDFIPISGNQFLQTNVPVIVSGSPNKNIVLQNNDNN